MDLFQFFPTQNFNLSVKLSSPILLSPHISVFSNSYYSLIILPPSPNPITLSQNQTFITLPTPSFPSQSLSPPKFKSCKVILSSIPILPYSTYIYAFSHVRFLRNVSGLFLKRELTKPNNCMTRSSCLRSSWPLSKNWYSSPSVPVNEKNKENSYIFI